jgi:hypothetical protein
MRKNPVSSLLGQRCSALLSLGAIVVSLSMQTASAEAKSSPPLPLKIVGTEIQNSKNEPVLLHGVNAAGMEWTSNGEEHILPTVIVSEFGAEPRRRFIRPPLPHLR